MRMMTATSGLQALTVSVDGEAVTLYASDNVPGADRLVIIVQGYPERAGVWSNTLLGLGRAGEASMAPHVDAFAARGWGTVVLDPHADVAAFPPAAYETHLRGACSVVGDRRAAAVAFSMGVQALFDFVLDHPVSARTLRGAVLLDPILAWKASSDVPDELRHWLEGCALHLVAERDQTFDVGDPEGVLGLAAMRHQADLHGALPYVALGAIVEDLGRMWI